MDLIDRYAHEVGRHLPARLRDDVEAELQSLLNESLEERSRVSGRPADAALAAEVLREFGKPRDIASRYAPEPQYLIGPTLYPVYTRVVKIIIAGCAIAALVMMSLGRFLAAGESPSLSILVRATESFLSGAVYNLGIVTLVFALVERAMRLGEAKQQAAWDPARLPAVNDRDRISYFGRIFLLYAIAAVALVFNFFPEWIGVVMVSDTGVRVVRLLEPAFGRYLPLLNLGWAAAFILGLVVLREGRWTRPTRWAEFGLELFNAAVLVTIVLGPKVFYYDPFVKLALQLFVAIGIGKAGFQLYRLISRRPVAPWSAAANDSGHRVP